MYFNESEVLSEKIPSLRTDIETIDAYFGDRLAFTPVRTTVSSLVATTGVSERAAHLVLHHLAEKGAIRKRIAIQCSNCTERRFFDAVADVPETYLCPACDESTDPEDTKLVFFEAIPREEQDVDPSRGREGNVTDSPALSFVPKMDSERVHNQVVNQYFNCSFDAAPSSTARSADQHIQATNSSVNETSTTNATNVTAGDKASVAVTTSTTGNDAVTSNETQDGNTWVRWAFGIFVAILTLVVAAIGLADQLDLFEY